MADDDEIGGNGISDCRLKVKWLMQEERWDNVLRMYLCQGFYSVYLFFRIIET